jgi:hypothetical protein
MLFIYFKKIILALDILNHNIFILLYIYFNKMNGQT